MGIFPPSRNDDEDEAMMICDDYNGASFTSSPNGGQTPSSYFPLSNGMGNDFCPHSSLLFPLMEADEELPLVESSLRKQTAVTCLTALADEEEFLEGSTGSSHDDFGGGIASASAGLFCSSITTAASTSLRTETNDPNKINNNDDDDEWGQFFAHQEAQFARSSGRVRLPTRTRPHQRRRSAAKYDRRGNSSSAWRG